MTFTGHVVEGLDPIADRAGWLEFRRGHIGGSDVAGILGISNYASQWSLWAEKCGLLAEEPDNEVMEAGRWLEHAIAPWFTDRTGLHVIGAQTVVTAGPFDDPIASCTVDGFVAEWIGALVSESEGNLQIKTRAFGKRWETIPPDIQAQCQWEMYVTGLPRTWIPVLMGRRLDVHELERDDTDIAFIVDRVHRFWAEHVLTGTPPATDGHDATLRAIASVYPTHTPDMSVPLDELADVLDQWRDAKAAKAAAEKLEKEAKAAIQVALGDAEEGTVAGERVVSWCEQTRKSYVVEEATFRVLRATSKKKEQSAA